MNLAAVVIAGLALLVSVVALILGQLRAQKADKRDEKRAQREEIEWKSSQQGRPTTDLVSREPGPGRAYQFRVTNIGRSAITHLRPELVDTSGDICSQPLRDTVLGALQAGQWAEFVLEVAEPVNRNPLFLHYTWHDMTGLRERLSKATVPTT
jgi:hypothetical protein